MAGENDQCRWVGIRPTNPPEAIPVTESSPITSIEVEPAPGSADFPVTLGAEVPHVIVDSGGGGFMPGAPIIADYFNLTSTKDVWYAILDIDPGAGHIQKLHIGSNVTTENVEIGVTVDGGARVTYSPVVQTVKLWQDLVYNTSLYKEVPIFLIRYTTSIKVEIRQTRMNNDDIYGLVSYLPD